MAAREAIDWGAELVRHLRLQFRAEAEEAQRERDLREAEREVKHLVDQIDWAALRVQTMRQRLDEAHRSACFHRASAQICYSQL